MDRIDFLGFALLPRDMSRLDRYSTRHNIPVAAAFTPAKIVDTPRWFLGDSGFDMLGWHDWLLEQSVVPISPYN